MKNILLIFRNRARRGALMLAVSFVAAVFMALVFYTLISSGTEDTNVVDMSDGIKVGLMDYDNSPLSEDLKDYLENELEMTVTLENDYNIQANLLIDKNISAIIEVPWGFCDSAAAGSVKELVLTTLDDYQNAAFIELYLNSYMQGIKVLSSAAGGSAEIFSRMLSADVRPGEVKVEREERGRDVHSAFVFAEGFLLMIVTGITLFISNSIISDRQQGTYSRIVCSPIKPAEYIIGMALFGIICGTVVNGIFTVYAYALEGNLSVPQGISLAAGELFALFSVGLSIMLALLIKSRQTLFAVGIGYTTFGCMLGGAWFPIADGLGALGNVAKIFPQYWFMSMLRDSGGNPDYSYFPSLCILALFALLVYLICAVLFLRKSS